MNQVEDAVRGSRMLREAILTCMGIKPPPPPRRQRRRASHFWWTQSQFKALRKLADAKLSSIIIGAILGRSPSSVRAQAWKLGISLDHRKYRAGPRPINRAEWTQADWLSERASIPNELAELVVAMCDAHPSRIESVRGPKRAPELVRCRQRIAVAARDMGYSYPTIGRALNRDHTTVIHAIRTADVGTVQ